MKDTDKVLIDDTKNLFDKTASYKDLLVQKNISKQLWDE